MDKTALTAYLGKLTLKLIPATLQRWKAKRGGELEMPPSLITTPEPPAETPTRHGKLVEVWDWYVERPDRSGSIFRANGLTTSEISSMFPPTQIIVSQRIDNTCRMAYRSQHQQATEGNPSFPYFD